MLRGRAEGPAISFTFRHLGMYYSTCTDTSLALYFPCYKELAWALVEYFETHPMKEFKKEVMLPVSGESIFK